MKHQINNLIEFVDNKTIRHKEILITKNADYSTTKDIYSNFEYSSNLTDTTIEQNLMIEITKKISRLANLIKPNTSPQNESITDTFDDLHNYLFLLENKFDR